MLGAVEGIVEIFDSEGELKKTDASGKNELAECVQCSYVCP